MISEKVVIVDHLNKTYGKKKVLNDITFEILSKEIVGFIGPNGAGKSTTMKCLCNLVFPDSGKIIINGYDIFRSREKALQSQAALIENPGLYMDMTGYDNMKLIAKLRKVSKQRIEEMAELTGLGRALSMKVRKYSLGMKQRLGLGIALLSKPRLLILDEPTNGLDPTGVIQLRNLLQELVSMEGISILFSSHQLGEIERLANRILCINNGSLVDIPELRENKTEYILHVSDTEKAIQVLNRIEKYESTHDMANNVIRLGVDKESNLNEAFYQLICNDIKILTMSKVAVNIEKIYKQVYGENDE